MGVNVYLMVGHLLFPNLQVSFKLDIVKVIDQAM